MPVKTFARTATAAAVVLALAAGYVVGERHVRPELITDAHAAAMMPAEAAAKTGIPDFSGLAETYGPAVVNISATHQEKARASNGQTLQLPMDPNDPFYQFFKHFYGGMPGGNGGGGGGATSTSLGSGFIVNPNGYILTNAHVVDGANVVTVRLTDKREFHARVIGSDKQSDIAVLKIEATGLPTVQIGNPNLSKVGQWVVAIGSPYGFNDTVTSGIISAKSRSLPDETYVPFIQTDVPVNPGNSGGPLFNMDGQVIGINSMIYSQTGGFQGLSFAIPIDVAMKVEDELIKHGHVERGRIGVAIQELNQSLAKSFGLSNQNGALVASVEPNSPAAKAGLKPGDVILSVNGTAVKDSADLPETIADIKPGSNATLQIWRNGSSQQVAVTIGNLADQKLASANTPSAPQGRLGLAVRELTPQERDESSLQGGLVVEQSTGPAASAGIQPGDVVLAINGQPVTTPQQLSERVSHAGSSLALLIQRDNAQIFVPVDLG